MGKQPSYLYFSPVVTFQKELNAVWTARGGLRLACELVSGSPSNQEDGTAGDAGSLPTWEGGLPDFTTLGCLQKVPT